ncbi:pyrroline-5-carboxylate reductase [Fructilactobacillus ixorae]|uniref:Pyrroline-5-carboxylate reductase n=1 Tax=Fructilactobacillus ixorae TaxID=1750535 RepID=A0ABY5C3P6_9LACO|nr:pyrroline-5-carboxylate reductase [Fructilactobacillus ixorae]USS93410.1 pyrroline-5-carboxylate reductase [Fructilactobacillus ixorae]
MKIGILGIGHMGTAILKGLCNCYDSSELYVKAHHVNDQLLALQRELGFQILTDEQLQEVDVLFITTPAAVTINILNGIQLNPQTTLISAVQGVTPTQLKTIFPENSVVCIIPNIPVAVNAGCIAMATTETATSDDQHRVTTILHQLGTIIPVPEANLGIVGTVAGCGPAFVDIFLSALSDAAVQNGLDRPTATKVAASMVYGSGKLALETGAAPDALKDQVTSPGGSTIKGVVGLDEKGFRAAINYAVNQANGTN